MNRRNVLSSEDASGVIARLLRGSTTKKVSYPFNNGTGYVQKSDPGGEPGRFVPHMKKAFVAGVEFVSVVSNYL
jgi:hypothetical protein